MIFQENVLRGRLESGLIGQKPAGSRLHGHIDQRVSFYTGSKELRDALKLLLPNADFRDAALNYCGEPITVSWPSDNGRQTVTRTFYPPFTPVDREEDYRVAYEFFRGRQ